jgi:hypothetical protein
MQHYEIAWRYITQFQNVFGISLNWDTILNYLFCTNCVGNWDSYWYELLAPQFFGIHGDCFLVGTTCSRNILFELQLESQIRMYVKAVSFFLQEVFNCMLRNLFEEYKFFPQYPDKELHITAQLFGGIIEQGLVRYVLFTHLMLYVHNGILVLTVFYQFSLCAYCQLVPNLLAWAVMVKEVLWFGTWCRHQLS